MGDVRHREEVSPSYSWYVRDWRASHRVRNLSWKERGFYRECLDWSWDLDGLPNDLDYIRGRLHATKGDFDKMWPAARQFYDVAPDGRLRNARQELERRKLHAFLRRSSDGGKATAGGKQTPPVPSGGMQQGSAPPVPSAGAEQAVPATASALHVRTHLHSHRHLPKEREEPASLSPPADPFLNPQTTDRAGRFLDRYELLYPKHRNGARYARKPVRDYAAAVTLCDTWPDDRLDKLAVIFLTTDHKFAEEGSRTVPQFLAIASWCDGKLAEHEAKQRTTA